MFNGTPNGTRTRITGLRGQPPIPFRGWEHKGWVKLLKPQLRFCRPVYVHQLTVEYR